MRPRLTRFGTSMRSARNSVLSRSWTSSVMVARPDCTTPPDRTRDPGSGAFRGRGRHPHGGGPAGGAPGPPLGRALAAVVDRVRLAREARPRGQGVRVDGRDQAIGPCHDRGRVDTAPATDQELGRALAELVADELG